MDCNCINVKFGFSILVLEKNKGSEELMKWYNKVFLRQNPNCEGDFVFTVMKDEDDEVIEIMQNDPSLSADALIALFTAFQRGVTEDSADESKIA